MGPRVGGKVQHPVWTITMMLTLILKVLTGYHELCKVSDTYSQHGRPTPPHVVDLISPFANVGTEAAILSALSEVPSFIGVGVRTEIQVHMTPEPVLPTCSNA